MGSKSQRSQAALEAWLVGHTVPVPQPGRRKGENRFGKRLKVINPKKSGHVIVI